MDDISANETDIEATLSLADAKLVKLIEAVVSKIGRLRITAAHSSPFEALTRAIIYQQMSAGAATTIYKKLQQSLEGAFTPREVLALPHDALRAVGLSKSKAQYVLNLAEWFNANPDTAKNLPTMSNDEVIKALTSIPGIGVWTANVFLMFNLQRLDVVPATELEFVAVSSWHMGSRRLRHRIWFTKSRFAGNPTEALLLCIYGMRLS